MASFIEAQDPNLVTLASVDDTNEIEEQFVQNHDDISEEADNFRDILCIIIASIGCCPLMPCASWVSLYYQQKATEAYWIGDYTAAGLKQSLAVKWLIGQCVVGPIILIVMMVLFGNEVFQDIYPISINGAE